MAQGHRVYPENAWEKRILEEHSWWKEYGCPFDARARLPEKEYEAHLAIMEGEIKEQKRQERKQKRKMNRSR